MPETIPPPAPDHIPSPEILPYNRELVALQGRLLLGADALKTSHSFTEAVTLTSLQDTKTREQTTTLMQTTSVRERTDFWEKQPQKTFEEKKEAWKQSVVSIMQGNKDFYATDVGKHHTQVLQQFGINTLSFDDTHAESLYTKYFAGQNKDQSIKTFIADARRIYTTNNTIDYIRLQNDLPVIQWFAGIFGANSAEITAQLLDAEGKITQPKEGEAFVQQLNTKTKENTTRINDLTQKEIELLTFLGYEGSVQPVSQTEPTESVSIISAEENLRVAQLFCEKLRNRIKTEGKKTPDGEYFEDQKTKIKIFARNQEEVGSGNFDEHGLINWAEQNNLPIAFTNTSESGGHARLLLKPPEKNPNRSGYRILVYDPMLGGEHYQVYENVEDIASYNKKELQKVEQFLDQNTQIYSFPPSELTPEGIEFHAKKQKKEDYEKEIYYRWLSGQFNLYATELAKGLIINGQYDFSLQNDAQLSDQIIHAKTQKLQFDATNCAALSFYSASLRYAAKPGDNEFKRKGLKKFEEDFFGIHILPREQIIR